MTTLIVTNNSGDASVAGSLAAAVAAASPGDTIEIAPSLAGSTISLASTLAIASSVTIVAPVNADGTPSVTLDGTNAGGPIATVAAGADVSITGLAFANGNATGAAGTDGQAGGPYDGGTGGDAAGGILNSGNLTLANVSFTNDTATGGDGGDGNSPYFGGGASTGGNGGTGGNAAGAIYDEAGSSLTYASGSVSFSDDTGYGGYGGFNGISFDSTGTPTQIFAPGADGTGSADVGGVAATITAPCFAEGTRILTARGETDVAALAIGDTVLLADGGTAPVVWIGHRRVHCRLHPAPAKVMPVRVRAGALGENVPKRDLVLSPDHALHLDGVLIPAGLLVNEATIVAEPRDRVVYYHVELDRHAVLLAEGAAAESYLDTGNRMQFANCGMVALHPDFGAGSGDGDLCAEMVFEGPRLEAVRARLAARAAQAAAEAQAACVEAPRARIRSRRGGAPNSRA